MSAFEHQFLVKIREAMEEKAKDLGVQIQFVEAQGDIGKQLNQIQTFNSQDMDALIVNPVDTMASPKMTKLVTEAGYLWFTLTFSRLRKLYPTESHMLVRKRSWRASSRGRRSPNF